MKPQLFCGTLCLPQITAMNSRKNKIKNTARTENNFRNNAFHVLKSAKSRFSSAKAATPDKTPEPQNSRTEKNEEEIFLKAMHGIKRIGIEEKKTADYEQLEQRPMAEEQPGDSRDKELFLQAMQSIGAASFSRLQERDSSEEKIHRASSNRMKQLKRGTIRISAELDLHGFLREEALRRLHLFLSSAFARGRQAVLVITGKGNNSPDGPVLRTAVADWLRSHGSGMVAEFQPAPRDKGGNGAFVVFLKSR